MMTLPHDRTHVDYFFDPICPFCWVTSKWVRQVQSTGYPLDVSWRFISLAILNEDNGSPHREGHLRGLELLRIASAVEEAADNEAVGRYYEAIGNRLWETAPAVTDDATDEESRGLVRQHQARVAEELPSVLDEIALDSELAAARFDEERDGELRRSTREALRRSGPDVGTPIISFEPPDGPAFFGPVISTVAEADRSVELWEAFETLAHYPSFAEVKRSIRDTPDTVLLRAAGGA